MRLFIITFLLLCSLGVWAQKQQNISKVKLKDDSELHVLIIENIPGDHIKVELPGKQEATIAYSEVASIRQKDFSYFDKYNRESGLFWEGSFSFVFGQASEDGGAPRAGMELGATLNYRFNPYINTGIGIEPMVFFINNETVFVPVYARFKGLFLDHRVTPYYTLDAGWSFAEKTASSEALDVKGGWFVRNTLGVQVGHFSVGVGYQLQKVTTTKDLEWWWWGANEQTITEDRLMKNVVFTTSFTF